jgi:WD40 repeat protein
VPHYLLLVSSSSMKTFRRESHHPVWDIVGESGLCRLRGHKGEITDVKFLYDGQFIVSSSKDTYLKVWELATQHCIQTLVRFLVGPIYHANAMHHCQCAHDCCIFYFSAAAALTFPVLYRLWRSLATRSGTATRCGALTLARTRRG